MELKNILKNGTEFKEQVYMLYEEAFPAEEKNADLSYGASCGKGTDGAFCSDRSG